MNQALTNDWVIHDQKTNKVQTSDTSEMLYPTINQDCKGEEHSEAVSNVESPHDKIRVNYWVIFSDEQDDEIQSESPVESNSWPNKWQMADKIDLYSHSTISFKTIKQSLKHACLVLFSSFCAISMGLKYGVHSHQVLANSSSKQVGGNTSTQPHGLCHSKKSEQAGCIASTQPNSNKTYNTFKLLVIDPMA
jgi:hypothetical protein